MKTIHEQYQRVKLLSIKLWNINDNYKFREEKNNSCLENEKRPWTGSQVEKHLKKLEEKDQCLSF